MSDFSLRTPQRRGPSLGVPELRLDPDIQAQIAALRPVLRTPDFRRRILQPDWHRLQQSELDRMLARPLPEPSPPLVPRGAGPATPRVAEMGDLLNAIWAIPDVQAAGNRVLSLAQESVERGWRHASRTDRRILVGTGIVMGGATLTAIIGNRQTRQSALELLEQIGEIPVPGVDGLRFSLNPRGGTISLEDAGVPGLNIRLGATTTTRPNHPLDAEGMITFDIAEYLRSP
jgi:hypothetical protein